MDQESVRSVLQSSGKFMQSLAAKEDLDKLINKVPVLDQTTSAALSTSLTDLITYKVTPDAYQRYSVRIKLIEMLREWIRPPIGLTSYPTFCHNNNLLQLCQGMIKKFFSYENFDNVDSAESFIIFGKELINIATRNSLYIPHVKSLFHTITNSDMPFDIHELVESVLDHDEQFELEFSLVETLYTRNCLKLIEEPLIDCFLANQDAENVECFVVNSNFEKLMRRTSKSPQIFQIICSILKELFVRLEYSSLVLDYIQFFLETVVCNRADDRKCTLDLYPLDLQGCVILLRIKPSYHTANSKEFTLQTLKNIYAQNTHQTLTLLTHFPDWLDPLSEYIPEWMMYN